MTLYTLRKNNKWEEVDNLFFIPTYNFIKGILDNCEGKGNTLGKINIEFNQNNYNTKIIEVQSNRLCTVAFCIQTNNNTGTTRFLVYGTRYNLHSDYGIGVDLNYYDCAKCMKLCPQGYADEYFL